jgi:hypothetical protein
MADVAVRDEMVEFVKMEVAPGSNEYYDPVTAGNVLIYQRIRKKPTSVLYDTDTQPEIL